MIYQVKLLKPNFFLQSIFYRCKDQGISLCIINKEMKDVFVCYAREEEEENILMSKLHGLQEVAAFYAMFYISFME